MSEDAHVGRETADESGMADLGGTAAASTPPAPAEEGSRRPSALTLLEHLPDMVFVVDALGTLRYVNSALASFLGRPAEALLGTKALELVHREDRALAAHLLTDVPTGARASRASSTVRVVVHAADGGTRTRLVELLANNLLDTAEVGGIVLSARDVTDRPAAPEDMEEARRRVDSAFELHPFARVAIDLDGFLTRVNRSMTELSGYAREELVGMHFSELAHPDEIELEAATARRLADQVVHHDTAERRLRKANGEYVWVRRTLWLAYDARGRLEHINGELGDVTAQRKAQKHILQLRDVLESSHELVTFTDPDGTIQYVNQRARTLLGLQEGDQPRENLRAFQTPETADLVVEEVIPALTEHGLWKGELTLLTTAGEEIPVTATVQYHHDEHGEVALVSAMAHDIRELKRAHRLLEHQATHDVLTMLPNRQLFQELGEQALARADREGTTVAVLFLDLDRFKRVNDSFGHPVGDELLVEVAGRLRDSVRRGDAVARFGGDEFAICCEHPAGQREMLDLAGRLIDALSRPIELGAATAEVGVSIGIAIGAGSRVTIDTLLRDADVALYRAKEQGRGRAVIFGTTGPADPV